MTSRCGGSGLPALLLACALAITSCATGTPHRADDAESNGGSRTPGRAAPDFESVRVAELEVVLARWADALRSGNAEALAEVFHPAAAREFVESEQRRARYLAGVPLAEWRYEVTSAPEAFVPPDLAEDVGSAETWAPEIRLVYQLASDRTQASRTLRVVVARHGEEWRLVDDGSAVGEDRADAGPWDFGPIRAETVPWGGRESLILAHPGDEDIMSETAELLPEALDEANAFWRTEWDSQIAVFVAQTSEEFSAITGGVHDHGFAAAVAVSDPQPTANRQPDTDIPREPRSVTGQRIVLNAPVFRQLSAETRTNVLRHELSHVITREQTDPATPLWVLEGAAEFVGRTPEAPIAEGAPRVRALVLQHGRPDTLPRDDHFLAGGETSALAYELAWTFVAFLADTFGTAKIPRIYYELAAPGSGRAVIDERLRTVTGSGLSHLIEEWGAWLEREME